MTEKLLQFIWQHSLYQSTGLTDINGEPVTVIYPGRLNTDAGPDFIDGRIKIGNTTWAGNIELHIKSSDWLLHGHQHDPAYNNIILHVVMDHDAANVTEAPVLVLASHISSEIISRYQSLIHNTAVLPCAHGLGTVKSIVRENWLARLLAERWELKLADWNVLLENATEDWRNLLYWRLGANFGFKTNSTPFLTLVRSIPLNVLARHRHDLSQLEAILFGQAGMLTGSFEEAYPERLQQEYQYLKRKYSLTPIPVHLWKFLRMRPANFPTVRIAQFANLIHTSEHLFSKIIESASVAEIEPLLQVTASDYWDDHYKFGEAHEKKAPKSLGKDSVLNIIINTIAPIQFLYAAKQGNGDGRERAMELLNTVPAEQNNITAMWTTNGWKAENASQSQALIQLFNEYCTRHRCLECAIGASIIRK